MSLPVRKPDAAQRARSLAKAYQSLDVQRILKEHLSPRRGRNKRLAAVKGVQPQFQMPGGRPKRLTKSVDTTI